MPIKGTRIRVYQNRGGKYRLLIHGVLCLMVLGTLVSSSSVFARPTALADAWVASHQVFMPLAIGNSPNMPVLLGIYSQGWPGDQNTMDNEFHSLDTWAGKKLSIAGTFIDFEDPNPVHDVTDQLRTMWDNGYTPFVNIATKRSAYAVASGQIDAAIRSWARAFKNYANNGQRMAFLAPLQEMNGDWVPYGLSPGNYKLAYDHIRSIFSQEGVPAKSVRWTFAPNGWSDPKDPPFEDYYPGDDKVDVVAFSSYNFGYTGGGAVWMDPEDVFPRYMRHMYAMAPSKPIFVAQTATSAYAAPGQYNVSEKNRWLREAYPYLLTFKNIRAIIYFNLENGQGIDWPFYVYNVPSKKFTGYREGITDSRFGYIPPVELINADLSE